MGSLTTGLRIAVLFVTWPLPFASQWAFAAPGDPVALTRLQSGGYKIETMWNLRIEVQPPAATPQRSMNETARSQPYGRIDASFHANEVAETWLLDRPSNSREAVWKRRGQVSSPSSNAVQVGPFHAKGIENSSLLVSASGLKIAFLFKGSASATERTSQSSAANVDVLVIGDGLLGDAGRDQTGSPGRAEQLMRWITVVNPNMVVIPARGDQLGSLDPDEYRLRSVAGNTVAISKGGLDTVDETSVIRLGERPIKLDGRLLTMIAEKERQSQASQQVFETLSPRQLNFQPANGTHTPRWNAEHMMGRELLFFSQIYGALDPALEVVDLNPAQMPPDYRPRHRDWNGFEEACQMQRVADYTRRFAYLLDNVQLDEQAPGSRWTLLGLLEQMQRHYGEHTANVREKFELPDWPADDSSPDR